MEAFFGNRRCPSAERCGTRCGTLVGPFSSSVASGRLAGAEKARTSAGFGAVLAGLPGHVSNHVPCTGAGIPADAQSNPELRFGCLTSGDPPVETFHLDREPGAICVRIVSLGRNTRLRRAGPYSGGGNPLTCS